MWGVHGFFRPCKPWAPSIKGRPPHLASAKDGGDARVSIVVAMLPAVAVATTVAAVAVVAGMGAGGSAVGDWGSGGIRMPPENTPLPAEGRSNAEAGGGGGEGEEGTRTQHHRRCSGCKQVAVLSDPLAYPALTCALIEKR